MYRRYLRPDELMHFGVKGMHWGVRRYQNPDGTLTPEGKRRMSDVNYDESTKSAGATKRSLNYLSKQKSSMDAEAATSKKNAAEFKDRGMEFKYKAAVSKGKEYAKRSAEIDNMMKQTISVAKKKGQTPYVNKQVSSYVYSGKQRTALMLSSYMFGLPGYLVTDMAAKAVSPERYQVRNKYKVR